MNEELSNYHVNQNDQQSEATAKPDESANNSEKPGVKSSAQKLDLYKFRDIARLVYECDDIHKIKPQIAEHTNNIFSKLALQNYTLLFLYQPYGIINEYTADKLYNSIPKKNKDQTILLIINSPGGLVESAYLISKSCREFSKRFVVSIPRKAKSAATLIALGAHEIHMGTMSELGPIDPQFGGLPALGLSSALERLANLATRYPKSSEMFASYLVRKLDLGILGYFERVSESAVQYAQRLLQGKDLPSNLTPEKVAYDFVYSYKDHSFVIDKDEAKQSLGEHIRTNTVEYELGNELHSFFESLNLFTRTFKSKNTSLVGDVNSISFDDKADD